MRVPAMAAPGGLGSLRASTGNEVTMGTSSAAALADEDERVRSNGDERGEVAGVGALTEVPTQGEVRELAALDRGSSDGTGPPRQARSCGSTLQSASGAGRSYGGRQAAAASVLSRIAGASSVAGRSVVSREKLPVRRTL